MGDCCEQFEELLFEPEEDLSEVDRERLSSHLSACEKCNEERDLFLESWSALGQFEPELDPSPLIRAKVWEQIREEEKQPAPLIQESTVVSVKSQLMKLAVASIALLLGFGLGRGLRPAAEVTVSPNPSTLSQTKSDEKGEFLDPALIKLASQDGFSVEIFPESNNFSPIDRDMMSALAPTEEDRKWVTRRRGAVVPVQYISSQYGGVR